jgi:CelD/BcsL family acetyltransferase involved in cellulose biosynthesis
MLDSLPRLPSGALMIVIREFTDLDDRELSSAWEEATDAGRCPNLFMSHPWVRAWSRQFEGERAPSILVGYSGQEPVGIAPLFRGADGSVEFPISTNPASARGEFIVDDGAARTFGAAVLTHLRARGDAPVFRGVPLQSPTFASLWSSGSAFFRHARLSRAVPQIDIDATWEEFLSSRPRKVTHEWERKIRRIERAGSVRIESGSVPDVESLVREFVAIEGRSWKEERGSSIGRRGVDQFYVDAARLMADRGWFRPFWLTLDGRMIAFIYGAVFNGTYWAIKTSFDQEFAELSPSVRLFHEAVGTAFREGLSRFDFVGHASRWTAEWATGRLEHVDVRLFPRTPRGLVGYVNERLARPALSRLRGLSSTRSS